MNDSRRHIVELDYFRGIAILAVLVFHTLGFVFSWDETLLPWNGVLRDDSSIGRLISFLPISIGQIGVQIFFVVSGFCIHASFQQNPKLGEFFFRRFFRIYPPYFAALTFCVLLEWTHYPAGFANYDFWRQIGMHLSLLFNFSESTIWVFNKAFWSLAVEAQLYLIYPLFLALVRKVGWRNSMLIAAAVELLIRCTNFLPGKMWDLTNSPFGYWFSWLVGAFIAEAFLHGRPLPFLKSWLGLWLFVGAASFYIKPLYYFRFPIFAFVTAICLSRLLNTLPIDQPPNPQTRGQRFLGQIGIWSYSLYLLHWPLLDLVSNLLIWFVPDQQRTPAFALFVLVAAWPLIFLMSYLWHKAVELPSIDVGKNFLQVSRSGRSFRKEKICCAAIVVVCLFIAATLTHPNAVENNNRAWTLATSPNPAERNGKLAVHLAEDACERTRCNQTIMVGTLAAAYAEAGRFDEAVVAANRAIEFARSRGETNLLENNQRFLQFYEKHQAYHEPSR